MAAMLVLPLYKKELGVKLHLGVIQEKNKIIYVPETFIVKPLRARDVDRLTQCQQYMNIINRNIEYLSLKEVAT